MAIGLLEIPAMSFTATGIVPLGADTWRWVFVFGALGLVSLPLILRLPESPRWLATHGRTGEAEAVVTALEEEFRAAGRTLPTPEDTALFHSGGPRYRSPLTGGLGRRTLMLSSVWIFQTLGCYGFVSWVPTLLAAHGFNITHSLTFSALTTLGAAPGALPGPVSLVAGDLDTERCEASGSPSNTPYDSRTSGIRSTSGRDCSPYPS